MNLSIIIRKGSSLKDRRFVRYNKKNQQTRRSDTSTTTTNEFKIMICDTI